MLNYLKIFENTPKVQQRSQRSGLLDKIGQNNCFKTTDAAIHFWEEPVKQKELEFQT